MKTGMVLAALAGLASTAWGQLQSQRFVTTTPSGAHVLDSAREAATRPNFVSPEAVLWTYSNSFFAIPESVAISTAGNSAWVGQTLNNERLQRFDIPGTGVPAWEFISSSFSFNRLDAAEDADRAVLLDTDAGGTSWLIHGFTSASNVPVWSAPIASNYNSASTPAISDDGAVAAFGFNDFEPSTGAFRGAIVEFRNAATGALLGTWTAPNGVNFISLTDDGATALVTTNDTARVVDVATLTQTFQASVVGSGGRFKIAGNGQAFVLGGFDFKAYRKNGASWTQAVSFSTANNWYGWGLGVSDDGSTVGVMSHNYALGYLPTSTRTWNVANGAQLGTFNTTATGAFQNSIVDGDMNTNGTVFAVASWGSSDNANPEVLVFNRTLSLIGSVDTTGSPFAIDLSSNGRYVLIGSKSVHANALGNGGDVTLYEIPGACCVDYSNDGEIDFSDIERFLAALVAMIPGNCAPGADLNNDGEFDFSDIERFLALYVAGCE